MKSQRIWLPVLMVAASFAGGALVNVGWAQKPRLATDVLQAEAFIVMDRDGNARAVLNTAADGTVGLVLRDPAGKERMRFGVDAEGGTHVALYDAVGRQRADLGSTGLILRDDAGRPRAVLTLDIGGQPSLVLLDEDRKGRAVLGSAKFQGPRPGEGVERPSSSLILLDEQQRVVFEAPPTPSR